MTFSIWLVSIPLCSPWSETHCVHSTVAFRCICLPVSRNYWLNQNWSWQCNKVNLYLSLLIKDDFTFSASVESCTETEQRACMCITHAFTHKQVCVFEIGRSGKWGLTTELATASSVYLNTNPISWWLWQQGSLALENTVAECAPSKKTAFVKLVIMLGWSVGNEGKCIRSPLIGCGISHWCSTSCFSWLTASLWVTKKLTQIRSPLVHCLLSLCELFAKMF